MARSFEDAQRDKLQALSDEALYLLSQLVEREKIRRATQGSKGGLSRLLPKRFRR